MASQNKKLSYQATLFIDNEDDRTKFYQVLDKYQSDKNMQQLTNSLKKILNKPERLRMYDAARALVPLDQQMDYNMMTPYISSKARTVKMARHKGLSLGFSIRGGREHSTGVFVSAVDSGSEAHSQGLKIGDQILRINGFNIDEATHEEVINLFKSRNQLVLKVKSVGMIPVKNSDDEAEIVLAASESDSHFSSLTSASTSSTSTISNNSLRRRGEDTVSWKVVAPSENSTTTATTTHSRKTSSSNSSHSEEFPEVKITLNNNSLKSFGCNICKGPPDNPGIFVQTIKEGGLAYEAGLRPGDQLLKANGNRLQSMEFQKTVEYLKSSKQVELVIKKGAGGYLFPGESSGYNSSNSSVNGEINSVEEFHSPLAAVNEEDNTTYVTDSQMEVQIINEIDNAIEEAEATDNLKKSQKSSPVSTVTVTSMINGDRELTLAEKKQLEVFKREEEEERIRKERIDEKLRNMEYASRLEAQMVDQDIIDNAEIILKQRRKSSSSSNETRKRSLVVEEVQEERQELAEESDEEVTETDVAKRRTSSGSKTPCSKSPTLTIGIEEKPAVKQNERWKKTILAEVHNTPSPKLNNGLRNGVKTSLNDKKNSCETQLPTTQSATTLQTNGTSQNEHQQRNQHDQLIEEFKKVHKKMIALQEKDEKTETTKEQKKIEVVEKKPVSILKKSSPEKRSEETLQISKGNFNKPLSLPLDNYVTMAANKELVKEPTSSANKPQQPNNKPELSTKIPHQSVESPAIVAIKKGKTKAITDSSMRIPKPPEYFFPQQKKSSVLVTIQSYQGENSRPTPQRFEFLKTHPSIEIEMLPNAQSGASKPVNNKQPSGLGGGVTKVAINRTNQIPNGNTKTTMVNNIPQMENSTKNNIRSESLNNIRQTIEKLNSGNNTDYAKPVRSVQIAEHSNVGVSSNTKKTLYNNALVQNGNNTNGKMQLVPKPNSLEINGNNTKPEVDVNNDSRLAKRQRAPMVGDHKVSIQISPEPIVVISSQK